MSDPLKGGSTKLVVLGAVGGAALVALIGGAAVVGYMLAGGGRSEVVAVAKPTPRPERGRVTGQLFLKLNRGTDTLSGTTIRLANKDKAMARLERLRLYRREEIADAQKAHGEASDRVGELDQRRRAALQTVRDREALEQSLWQEMRAQQATTDRYKTGLDRLAELREALIHCADVRELLLSEDPPGVITLNNIISGSLKRYPVERFDRLAADVDELEKKLQALIKSRLAEFNIPEECSRNMLDLYVALIDANQKLEGHHSSKASQIREKIGLAGSEAAIARGQADQAGFSLNRAREVESEASSKLAELRDETDIKFKALELETVETFTVELDGEFVFDDLEPGGYYLSAYHESAFEQAAWVVEVDVKAGKETRQTLSGDNALALVVKPLLGEGLNEFDE